VEEKKSEKWRLIDYLKLCPAIALAIVIFYYSSLSYPVPQTVQEVTFFDMNTVLHIGEYAVFSFFLTFGLYKKIKNYYIVSIGFLYALSDEIHQYFVPYRYFDFLDVLADGIGVFIGYIGFLIVNILILFLVAKIQNQEENKAKIERNKA
jgi:VanZ family protein